MSIAPPKTVTHAGVHFSLQYPVVRTTCGKARVPATSKWFLVTCLECLQIGSTRTDQAKRRLEQLEREDAESE